MSNTNFQTFFDCGSSKIRAATFNIDNDNDAYFTEREFLKDNISLELKIREIINSLERDSNKYINSVNLMIDSPKMLSISISLSKKLDGSKLKKENIKFLVQEAKQEILKYYTSYNIAHIIINNYKIDGIDYPFLPDKINCNFFSLDMLFICLPLELVLNFKNIFSKLNILVDTIICTSYAKSIYYKNNLNLNGSVSFIDVGYDKTSIITYLNENIAMLDVLSVGGNHITKDLSKVLSISLQRSEQIKLNFDQNLNILSEEIKSTDMLQKIILARTEEILELCSKSIKSNLFLTGKFKMVLTGQGSKILDSKLKDNISFVNDIDFLEETLEDICWSGFRLISKPNKQEVVIVPKKSIKHGFFEKLFHLFR
jgi:cell division protein FtsA